MRFSRRVNARYGLWGVRIGEASHPGPPKFLRRYRGVGHNVVRRLAERASLRATQLDSDDEFPYTVAVADTHLDSPELAAFEIQ